MAAAALINQCGRYSTSEVGLNFRAPTPCSPLVPVRGTNRDQCQPLVPVGATNRDQCPPLVPVGGTNRDECLPLVPVGATNRDQRLNQPIRSHLADRPPPPRRFLLEGLDRRSLFIARVRSTALVRC